jgi:predicted nuclease of predicted toxin-antitoxin system
MRLLLDNNLSPALPALLAEHDIDAVHVRTLGLARASDPQVMQAARDDDRAVVSADTDFGTLLARGGATRPSVVLIRTSTGRRPQRLADLLAANLPILEDDLTAGAVVVLTDSAVRVRRLPLPSTA